MARWYLNRPEEHTNEGEIRVANYLKRLPHNWTVVWGFFYEDKHKVRREGDFLLLAPFCGVLVLEVKGGVPRHFGPTGMWEGSKGDNPLNQLDDEWAAVIRKLKNTDARSLYVAKALGLPGVEAEPEAARVHGIDRGITITRNEFVDLNLLGKALMRLFVSAARGGEVRPVSEEARAAFIEQFAPGITGIALQAFTNHTEARFREQLIAEYRMLDMLRANQQLLVQGGCGSGKSWYALEQARRYAADGQRVLFLVYNRAVTKIMRADAERSNREVSGEIVVKNFEELAALIMGVPGASIAPPAGADGNEMQRYYEEDLPEQVIQAISNPSRLAAAGKFDALVVDEGQDHDTNLVDSLAQRYPHIACGWWSIYWQLLVNDTESPMAVFYDVSQRPMFRSNTLFEPDKIKSFLSQPVYVTLSRTLRYTRPIFEYLHSLAGEGTQELVDALCDARSLSEGPEVLHLKAAASSQELCKQLGRQIEEWQDSGICEPEDVLVLHARSALAQSALGETQWLGDYPLSAVENPSASGARVCSIHKAKGLDSKAVILVGVSNEFSNDKYGYHRNTHFMGASRARQVLAVVG